MQHDVIAWSCGFQVGQSGVGRKFLKFLHRSDQRVVAMFDGLTDWLGKLTIPTQHPAFAIRSLLQEVPIWLREEGDGRLGILVVVDTETVNKCIVENSGQFLSLHREYALTA